MSVRLRPGTFRDHLLTWFGTSVMFAGNGTEGLWLGRQRAGLAVTGVVTSETKVTATGPTSEAASRTARQKR